MIVGLNSSYYFVYLVIALYRVTNEGFFVFKGFLEIPYHIIVKYINIYYKYAARTGRTAEIVAEHIWSMISRKSACRCIGIPVSKKKPGGWTN